MPYYTITSMMTDKDSPLNQTLFEYIRENLDYLKAQADGNQFIILGGSAGEDAGTVGNEFDMGAAFNLQAPPSGKKWRLEVKIQGKKTTGTGLLRLRLYDKTDTQLSSVDSANLTSAYVDYTLTLDVTTAVWGRLVIRCIETVATLNVLVRNGATRAYLVDV